MTGFSRRSCYRPDGLKDKLQMNRAERRARFQRAVARAWNTIHNVWQLHRYPGFHMEDGVKTETPVDEAAMARRMAETHCRPCSCDMCQHRKDVPPPRERCYEA